MESVLYGLAIGSFICAGISAVIAVVIYRRLGVRDAWNFLRGKKVIVSGQHTLPRKKTAAKTPSKDANVGKTKTKSIADIITQNDDAQADSPTDIIAHPNVEKGTSTLFVEESESATTVLQEETEMPTTVLTTDTESPTTLLSAEDETESPTTLLEVDDTETPTSVLGEADAQEADESVFMFDIIQSDVVVHTDEEI